MSDRVSAWPERPLDEVMAKIQDGTHFSPASNEGPFRYLTSRNIRRGRLDLTDCGWISESEHRAIYRRCDPRYGDILLTKDGANTGNVALNPLNEEFSLLSSVAMLRGGSSVDNRYVFHYLASRLGQAWITSAMAGNAITRLTLKKIRTLPIPVPPLRVQRRIAEILDTIDETIQATERIMAKLETARSAVIEQQLDTAARTAHWVSLGSVAKVGGGLALSSSRAVSEPVSVPYLRVANVQDGYIDTSVMKTVLVSRADVGRYLLRAGDVLMNEGGDFDKLGRGAVWDGRINPCIHQNHVFRVRCNESVLLPTFLALYSGSYYGKKYFVNSSKQTTNLASINKTQLEAMPIPSIELEEQARLVEMAKAMDSRLQYESRSLVKLRTVRIGLAADLLLSRVLVDS